MGYVTLVHTPLSKDKGRAERLYSRRAVTPTRLIEIVCGLCTTVTLFAVSHFSGSQHCHSQLMLACQLHWWHCT